MTVTYPGSKKQWDDIDKGSNNDVLENNLICAMLEATFDPDNGESISTQTIDRGGKFTEPAAPSKENHTFAGWYNGDEKFDFGADTTNAPNVLELVAKWDINQYTVKFVSEHGDAPASQNVPYNETATNPGELMAEGYTFIGWYADKDHNTKFDFSTPITGDTKVYAKWEKNAPNTYALNVSGAFVYVDGVDFTASAGDTSLKLEKDASVRLVADPDRMPSGMVFDRWTILNGALNADDAEKFETGRTLEEFAFTMPAEPLSIEATPRMQEEEGSDTASVILGVTLGTAATALVAWQAYDLGMSLYQEHWLPADFVMPKTRAELALLLWNTAGAPPLPHSPPLRTSPTPTPRRPPSGPWKRA
ncbi:InlB B-repeat-containing protein [Faecalibacterium sp. OF04-11AC]|uniref:InlB B-repeat-containing protein n=1 Tax=Faecalibacterium sp. OF04-11AC TaxID=2293109 RepID=UPI000FE27A0B|nr:InlB B-repeat-containing protein [Faecalibacterium sp. OF04-11AC]